MDVGPKQIWDHRELNRELLAADVPFFGDFLSDFIAAVFGRGSRTVLRSAPTSSSFVQSKTAFGDVFPAPIFSSSVE
jgi:hypothetical protein